MANTAYICEAGRGGAACSAGGNARRITAHEARAAACQLDRRGVVPGDWHARWHSTETQQPPSNGLASPAPACCAAGRHAPPARQTGAPRTGRRAAGPEGGPWSAHITGNYWFGSAFSVFSVLTSRGLPPGVCCMALHHACWKASGDPPLDARASTAHSGARCTCPVHPTPAPFARLFQTGSSCSSPQTAACTNVTKHDVVCSSGGGGWRKEAAAGLGFIQGVKFCTRVAAGREGAQPAGGRTMMHGRASTWRCRCSRCARRGGEVGVPGDQSVALPHAHVPHSHHGGQGVELCRHGVTEGAERREGIKG